MRQRREVKVLDLFLYYYLTLFLIIITTILLVIGMLNISLIGIKIVIIIIYIIVLYFLLKYHAIGCVLMYKAYAPLSIRNRCRFEPSCSTYMIMSINKFGLFRGVIKGIKRIKRCHVPNGGIDYP